METGKNTIGMHLAKIDYNALCVYLLNFLKNYPVTDSVLASYFWLLRKNKTSNLFLKVCSTEVARLVSAGKLNLTESGMEHLFGEDGEFSASKYVESYMEYVLNKKPYDDEVTFFREDNEIDNEVPFSLSSAAMDDSIDFARILIKDGEKKIRAVMAYTLFAKPGDKGEDFVSLPENVKIPERVLKSLEDFSQIKVISDFFSLDHDESLFLNFLLRFNRFEAISTLTDNINDSNLNDFYATVLSLDVGRIRKIMRRDKPLFLYGIVDEDYSGKIVISEESKDCVLSGSISPFFASAFKETKAGPYNLETFSVDKTDVQIIQNLLKSGQNMNILLYGAPGSGKTEFAKSVINSVGKKILLFNNDLELDRAGSAVKALNRIAVAGQGNGSVIVVDEADKILDTVPEATLFGNSANEQKGTVNRMLEGSKNQIIWITNYIDQIDESTRRRFTFSLRFNPMNEDTLRLIAKNTIQDIRMSAPLREQILDMCTDYKVTGASVENMHKMLKCMNFSENENPESKIMQLKRILKSNSELLNGSAKMREKECSNYDITALNTSTGAEKIVHMIENAKKFAAKNRTEENGIRILFYGASGTGKTEFARYIAAKLNRQILIKRVSDIFSKYVGESEKNVASAFSEAESSDKILLFDEADSFFTDRSTLQNSWERNVVNEFLTCLEEFKGILICTTNLKQILDKAIQRRFHLFVEFRPLLKDGIAKLCGRYFSSIIFTDSQISTLAGTASVTPGDFASLASRLRFMDEEDLNADYIVNELLEIQANKENLSQERKIGFAG